MIQQLGDPAQNRIRLNQVRQQARTASGAELDALRAEAAQLAKNIQLAASPDIQSQIAQEQIVAAREADFMRGRARGEELLAEGTLGRLEGITEGQNQAIREQALLGLQGQQQAAQRALRGTMAASGVQGGLSGGLQSALLGQQAAERSQAEQAMATGLIETGMNINKFNLGQGQREVLGRIGIELGEAGLGAAERGALMQKDAATEAANIAAQAAQGGGGKK
jgi:hypothetical protein